MTLRVIAAAMLFAAVSCSSDKGVAEAPPAAKPQLEIASCDADVLASRLTAIEDDRSKRPLWYGDLTEDLRLGGQAVSAAIRSACPALPVALDYHLEVLAMDIHRPDLPKPSSPNEVMASVAEVSKVVCGEALDVDALLSLPLDTRGRRLLSECRLEERELRPPTRRAVQWFTISAVLGLAYVRHAGVSDDLAQKAIGMVTTPWWDEARVEALPTVSRDDFAFVETTPARGVVVRVGADAVDLGDTHQPLGKGRLEAKPIIEAFEGEVQAARQLAELIIETTGSTPAKPLPGLLAAAKAKQIEFASVLFRRPDDIVAGLPLNIVDDDFPEHKYDIRLANGQVVIATAEEDVVRSIPMGGLVTGLDKWAQQAAADGLVGVTLDASTMNVRQVILATLAVRGPRCQRVESRGCRPLWVALR